MVDVPASKEEPSKEEPAPPAQETLPWRRASNGKIVMPSSIVSPSKDNLDDGENDEANDDNLGEEISCDDWAVKIISNLHKFEENKVIGCQFFNQMVFLDKIGQN